MPKDTQTERTSKETNRLADLRTRFNAAARRVFTKNNLKLAAPLLMTTALVSDSQHHMMPERPIWGHSMAPQSGGDWLQPTPSNSIRNVLNCHAARTNENLVALYPENRSFHAFYTMAEKAGETGRFLHATALRARLNACLTSNQLENARYTSSGQIGIYNGDNDVQQLRSTAHGIAHALLMQTGQAESTPDEGLTSRLSRRLTAEALAITVEYMLAAELNARGDTTIWSLLLRENHPGFRAFVDALARHRFVFDGRPLPAATLQAAATEAANSLMREPDFIAFHADDIMRDALAEIAQGQVQRPDTAASFNAADAQALSNWRGEGASNINLGGQLRPLTHAELAGVARDTTARIEGLEHIKARKFGYTWPQRYVADNPYTNLKASDLSDWMQRTQGRYTVTQAMTRLLNGNIKWSRQDNVLSAALRYGIQSDYRQGQVPTQSRALWESLQILRRDSPLIGLPLINHTANHDVFMCYSQSMRHAAGSWMFGSGIVYMNPDLRDRPHDGIPTLAHEILHSVQGANLRDISKENYSIYDFQAFNLALEASARTVSTLSAIEMYANDRITRSHANVDRHIFDTMIQTFEAQSTNDRRSALEATGFAGYRQMFTVQWWLDAYNGRMIETFINHLSQKNLKQPQPEALSIDTLRKMGFVSDEFNFTRDVRYQPTDIERFGSNDQMRQMFAWLHYQHLTKTLGAENEQTVAQHDMLKRAQNPYLRLDFDAFRKEISTVGDSNYFLRIANRMVGNGPIFMIPPAGRERSKLVCS